MTQHRNASGLRRLMVATDLSPRAERAMARAAQAANEHGAALTVLHVLTIKTGDRARDRQTILEIEEKLRRKIEKLLPGHSKKAAVHVVTGVPPAEIIRHAREEASDIILVGAHGAQFIKDLLLYTTAEKIVRRGDCPVWVIKRPARGPYRRVLVASDFSDQSGHALQLAMRLAPHAKIYFLHAYQGLENQLWRAGITKTEVLRYRRQLARESRDEMKKFIRRFGLPGRAIMRLFQYGRAPHVITSAVRRLRPELLCVGSVRREGIAQILLGSVTEQVLRQVASDVLVVQSRSSPADAE